MVEYFLEGDGGGGGKAGVILKVGGGGRGSYYSEHLRSCGECFALCDREFLVNFVRR